MGFRRIGRRSYVKRLLVGFEVEESLGFGEGVELLGLGEVDGRLGYFFCVADKDRHMQLN
jgi:hypothetical protein